MEHKKNMLCFDRFVCTLEIEFQIWFVREICMKTIIQMMMFLSRAKCDSVPDPLVYKSQFNLLLLSFSELSV